MKKKLLFLLTLLMVIPFSVKGLTYKLGEVTQSTEVAGVAYVKIYTADDELNVNGLIETDSISCSITNKLDDESKQFYLQTINQLSAINHEYFNPNSKFVEYDETWFQNEKYIYRIYRKNNKVVGIVDYMVFEDNPNYGKPTNEVFNYNNKLCIRCLFAIEEKVLEDILKDLSNIYKKDIIISITYTDNILRKVVKKMNGKFNYCQYILVNN